MANFKYNNLNYNYLNDDYFSAKVIIPISDLPAPDKIL